MVDHSAKNMRQGSSIFERLASQQTKGMILKRAHLKKCAGKVDAKSRRGHKKVSPASSSPGVFERLSSTGTIASSRKNSRRSADGKEEDVVIPTKKTSVRASGVVRPIFRRLASVETKSSAIRRESLVNEVSSEEKKLSSSTYQTISMSSSDSSTCPSLYKRLAYADTKAFAKRKETILLADIDNEDEDVHPPITSCASDSTCPSLYKRLANKETKAFTKRKETILNGNNDEDVHPPITSCASDSTCPSLYKRLANTETKSFAKRKETILNDYTGSMSIFLTPSFIDISVTSFGTLILLSTQECEIHVEIMIL